MKSCPNCKEEVPEKFDVCWNCSYNFVSKKVEGFVSDKIKVESDSVKPKKLNCLRCKMTIRFEETIKVHEGRDWGLIGEIGHLFTNKKSFDIYMCPNCDKVEFFAPAVS